MNSKNISENLKSSSNGLERIPSNNKESLTKNPHLKIEYLFRKLIIFFQIDCLSKKKNTGNNSDY